MINKINIFHIVGLMTLIMGGLFLLFGAISTNVEPIIYGVMGMSLIISSISFVLIGFLPCSNRLEKKETNSVILLLSLNIVVVGMLHTAFFSTGYAFKNENLITEYDNILLWMTPIGLILLGCVLPLREKIKVK